MSAAVMKAAHPGAAPVGRGVRVPVPELLDAACLRAFALQGVARAGIRASHAPALRTLALTRELAALLISARQGILIRAVGLSVRWARKYFAILVPALIFVVALSAGVVAGSRWLPDLAAGQVGGLAFFVVCGLIGVAFGLLGVHIYLITEEVKHLPSAGGLSQAEALAGGIRNICFEVGSLFGFASVVYLLAPRAPEIDGELEVGPVS